MQKNRGRPVRVGRPRSRPFQEPGGPLCCLDGLWSALVRLRSEAVCDRIASSGRSSRGLLEAVFAGSVAGLPRGIH
jgi:hypothetical protein